MSKARKQGVSTEEAPIRPALTDEGRENQMIALAINCAEKQLRDGTASSQIITHYLKLATKDHKIETEILENQRDLIKAKTENLQSAKRVEELYKNALDAMRNYTGQGDSDDYDEY